MSWFAKIEETCAAFIERAFANMFPSDLEPAQIARKLVATMEARTQSVESAMIAPGRYSVFVNPADYERLLEHREYLEREWGALLADVAQRVGIRFDAQAPIVELREDDEVVAGAIEIEPQISTSSVLRLRVIKGMPVGQAFQVAGPIRVGRDTECEIFLVDPSVSRNHASVEPVDGELVVRDAGSTNGTFVNGQRIQLRSVRPGDVVAFGKTEMRVES